MDRRVLEGSSSLTMYSVESRVLAVTKILDRIAWNRKEAAWNEAIRTVCVAGQRPNATEYKGPIFQK